MKICFLLCVCIPLLAEEAYDFVGRHLVASYLDCDGEALNNTEALEEAMVEAINASGTTILKKVSHVFSPNGFTLLFLLAESHASIHTYPEHGKCFVDIFTCGTHCKTENFEATLRKYLNPKKFSWKILDRSEEIVDTSDSFQLIQ